MTLEDVIAERICRSQTLSDLAACLQILFENHSIFEGHLISTRASVGYANGLKIEIHPNDHAPPHFHVRGGNVDAKFAILDCNCIEGRIDARERELVRFWYKNSRRELIQVWNDTRPSDSQVGRIDE